MKRYERKRVYFCGLLAVVLMVCTIFGAGDGYKANAAGQKKTVRISCGINDLLYLDEDGNAAGYCKDYLDKLAAINNWEYEYVNTDWAGAVEKLENGELDLLFPTTKTAGREETMEFSNMFGGYMAPGLFARQDSEIEYMNYATFDGARIAVTEASSNKEDLEAFAKKYGFSYETVYISSMKDKIKALEDGTVDMVIFSAANNVPNANLVALLDSYPFYYTVKKGNLELLSELDSGMQQLAIHEPQLVGEVVGNCITGENKHSAVFTIEERNFIESQTEITVGFYEHTEPLAYVEPDGTYDGIYIALLNKIKEQTGLNIRLYLIRRDENWDDLLKDGTIDFYIGASDTLAKENEDFVSTNSFMEYKSVIVTKNDMNWLEEEKPVLALTKTRVYWKNSLPSELQDAELVYYKTARDCLLAVKSGKADATLLNTIEFNYHTKNARFSDLVQWENYRFESGASLVADGGIDALKFSVMNRALSSLTDSEVNDVTNQYLNMPYETQDIVDYLYPVRTILLVLFFLLVAIVITGAIVFRIRKKQRGLAEEKKEEEKRQFQILAALTLDYSLIYHVNLDEDQCTVVKILDHLRAWYDSEIKPYQGFFEAMHQYVTRFVTPESQEKMYRAFQKETILERLREDKVFVQRYQKQPNELGQENFEVHFVDVCEDENEHVIVVGFRCVDEIAREEIQQRNALREAFEAANRANDAKSDFLSKMSHDIRTPMNAIIGMTAIAASNIGDKERLHDALGKISSSSRHLLGLINEVLDMSRIESGKIKLNEEEFNLSDLLNNLLIMVQPQIKQHGHHLQVHILDMEHEDVIGDSLRIQQAFVNIMGNAVKYTPDHGHITLTVREKPVEESRFGCYEFVFEDDGMGMSEEFLEHIFEPFSREEDDRTNKILGTGLGMAITKSIVQMMNGDIQVESEEGKGSKFTITIFLKLQEKIDIVAEELKGLPVLVADEDSILCETVCRMLQEIGMESEWVLTGSGAVERVEQAHSEGRDFYAVILGMQTSDMSGVETAKAIEKAVGQETSPNLILATYDWSEIEMEARAAGIDAFLTKPIFKSGIITMFGRLTNGGSDPDLKSDLSIDIERDYSGKRVLLVEDNEINREIAAEILKTTGIEIEQAENGKEAVDKFSESDNGYYDIILMDVQMPVMNGYDATSAIRSLDRDDAMHVPIIATTANAFAEDVQAAKSAGMNEHLAKPIEIGKLREVLARYLD